MKQNYFTSTGVQFTNKQPISILKTSATPKATRNIKIDFGQSGTVKFKDLMDEEDEKS